MWITDLWNQFKRKLTHPLKELPSPSTPSKRVLCVEQLRRLSVERFSKYRATQTLGLSISPLYPNIELYTKKLYELSLAVEGDNAIPPTWFTSEVRTIPLDRFLISEDGHYLEVRVAVERFKVAATHLCEAMESSDYVHHGVPEHNLRILRKLFIDVQSVASALTEASTTEA